MLILTYALTHTYAYPYSCLDPTCTTHMYTDNPSALISSLFSAGIMFGKRQETEDGFELQMSTNYFGHFLLTSLLLDRLKETASKYSTNTRIVNVSSVAHYGGSWMDLQDLNLKGFYSEEAAYCQSKAAQVMFTRSLNRLLKDNGCDNLIVNAVHPGVVKTELFDGVWLTKYFNILASLLMKTPEQGGQILVHAACSPDVTEGGKYLTNYHESRSSSFVRDQLNQQELWNKTMDMLGIKEFGAN